MELQQKQFSEWFVARLGELVKESYLKAQDMDIEKEETKKIIKTVFKVCNSLVKN